jgi:phenylpyruvate tautomerase PptA (4-oxalocrotonate tautomerase family)
MPILEIEMITTDGAPPGEGKAAALAEAAAKVFESAKGRTWVRLSTLPLSQYAENGGGPAEGVLPVFVSVLKSAPPYGELRAAEAKKLAEAMALVLDRPVENVHVIFEPAAKGRIAFGGNLLQ